MEQEQEIKQGIILSKLRIFINKDNAEEYPELSGLVKEMQSKECTDLILSMRFKYSM